SGTLGFRWTLATGMQSVGVLSGKTSSSARAVSTTGNVVVGYSGSRAFRWVNGAMQDLGFLAGGTGAIAYGVSGNGQAVVGVCATPQGDRAFRWTSFAPMVDLGLLTGGTAAYATACST